MLYVLYKYFILKNMGFKWDNITSLHRVNMFLDLILYTIFIIERSLKYLIPNSSFLDSRAERAIYSSIFIFNYVNYILNVTYTHVIIY